MIILSTDFLSSKAEKHLNHNGLRAFWGVKMSLDKAILHGKEYRKQYTGCRAVDKSCRNHGDCPWCQGNRHYKNNKRMIGLKELLINLNN